MKNYWFLFGIVILLSSCISRLTRPAMSGTIVDFNGNPISHCMVGETYTDSTGYFELKEKRKGKFLLSEIMIMEAPPLFVLEGISKENFETKAIHRFSKYGGGSPRGTHWKMDTIYLKNTDYEVKTSFFTQKWKVAATKNSDTLFFVKSDVTRLCKTADCSNFYALYSSHSDNYYASKPNLPEGIIRKNIQLTLNDKNDLFATKIIDYGDKTGRNSTDKQNDTLNTKGKWHYEDKVLQFTSDFNELQGKYTLEANDYEYFLAVKIPLK